MSAQTPEDPDDARVISSEPQHRGRPRRHGSPPRVRHRGRGRPGARLRTGVLRGGSRDRGQALARDVRASIARISRTDRGRPTTGTAGPGTRAPGVRCGRPPRWSTIRRTLPRTWTYRLGRAGRRRSARPAGQAARCGPSAWVSTVLTKTRSPSASTQVWVTLGRAVRHEVREKVLGASSSARRWSGAARPAQTIIWRAVGGIGPGQLGRAGQVLVHPGRAGPALGDGPDDQRLAAAGVAADEDALDVGGVVVVPGDVAALVRVDARAGRPRCPSPAR